jgi:hypothetical protein
MIFAFHPLRLSAIRGDGKYASPGGIQAMGMSAVAGGWRVLEWVRC